MNRRRPFLARLRSRFGPARGIARRLGRRGERAAALALRRRGYRVLARNLRTPRGEVDLVALDDSTLVVVEVKTRRGSRGRPPQWRLRSGQRRRLAAAARWLLRARAFHGRPLRFDVVGVTFDGCRPVVTIRRGVETWHENRKPRWTERRSS